MTQIITPGRINGLRDISERTRILRDTDLQKKGRYIDFGWPGLNDATLGLDYGVFLIAAPANLGKSAMLLNMYCNIIEHNPDAFILDFSLDDSFEDRTRNAIARTAKIPINWVKLPEGIPDEAKKARNAAYDKWDNVFVPQLEIIDETDFDNKARSFKTIRDTILKYKDKFGDLVKLIVVIDGFHNVTVDSPMDEYTQNKYLSSEFKNLASETKSIIIASAHTPKGSMRRGLNQESVKGGTRASYDAKVISTVFSDVKVNRGAAQVYHDAILPHMNAQTSVRLPVIELDITKNKTGSYSDILFYRFYPEYAYIEEAPDTWQASWKKVVYG